MEVLKKGLEKRMARGLGVSASGTALIAESFASVLHFYISFGGSGVEDEEGWMANANC